MPYCHKPCYGALFGPQMFGYGSNVTSPANFRKSTDLQGDSPDASFEGDSQDGVTCIFKTTNTSPGPIKFQRNNNNDETSPLAKVFQKRHSSGGLETHSDSSGYSSNAGSSNGLDVVSENSGGNSGSGLTCVYQSNVNNKPKRASAPVSRSNSDAGKFTPVVAGNSWPSKIR